MFQWQAVFDQIKTCYGQVFPRSIGHYSFEESEKYADVLPDTRYFMLPSAKQRVAWSLAWKSLPNTNIPRVTMKLP